MTVYQSVPRRLPNQPGLKLPVDERVKLLAQANAALRRSLMAQGLELRKERQVGGSITRDERMIARAIEAKLKEKNT